MSDVDCFEKRPYDYSPCLSFRSREQEREQEKEKARAQTLLKKQQWLKRGCATEFDSRKMAKAVQDELPKAGMFDLYLASLKRAAKDKLWSSVLECAELLEKGKIFYIDMMISGFY